MVTHVYVNVPYMNLLVLLAALSYKQSARFSLHLPGAPCAGHTDYVIVTVRFKL